MSGRAVLEEQIKLLSEWNKEHIKDDPEQVNANIITICTAIAQYFHCPMR